MKKILGIMLLLTIVLTGCGFGRVEIDEKDNPFVVGKVEFYSDTHSKYVNKTWSGIELNDFLSSNKPTIVAPNGLWNVGDTITFKLLKK